MAKRIIAGYRVQSTDIGDIETVLAQMRNVVERISNASFKRLLEKQVERIVDEITLGNYVQPNDKTIFQIAFDETIRRARCAELHADPTEYNLAISAQVLYGTEIKKGGKTEPCVFIKVNGRGNEEQYIKAFNKIKGLYKYDLYDIDEGDSENDIRSKTWQDISSRYSNDMPLGCQLFSYDNLRVSPGNLKFRSVKERAAEIAQETILNHALNMYSCGETIQPHKLMEFMFQALNLAAGKELVELKEMKNSQLLALLREITPGMIKAYPGEDLRESPQGKPSQQVPPEEDISGQKECEVPETACGEEPERTEKDAEN